MCNCLSELENESVLETRLLIGWTRYVNPSEAWLLKHHGQRLGWPILPKVFIFTSTVIFPISYVPKVNWNQKYWIKIKIYYGFKPIKVLYYELLRGKKDIWILLQKSMKELNYWLQWVKVCLLGPPRLPKKIWGLWANILYVAQGAQISHFVWCGVVLIPHQTIAQSTQYIHYSS